MKYKILGYVFIFMIFAAAVSLLYYQQTSNNTPDYVDMPVHRIDKTYSNQEYGFEVKYPSAYLVNENSLGDYPNRGSFEANAEPVVSFNLPPSAYGATNLVDAYVYIGAAKNIDESDCKSFEVGVKNSTEPKTETISGVTYINSEYVGAAAGNRYESKTYRVMKDNVCFEINLNVQTGSIQNYDPDTVTEVNKNEVWEKLYNVLETFRFIS